MAKTIRDIGLIILTTVSLTLALWLPHVARTNFYGLDFPRGFSTIYENYDGLEYVVIAKSLYQPGLLALVPQSSPANYFASHFPAYSLAILFFTPLLGYLKSMLFVSVLFTIFSAIAFYLLARDFELTSHPLVLTFLFLILPARWLVVHSVGSSEPMFIFFVIASLYWVMRYAFKPKWQFVCLAALFGAGAQLTRPPGILLFIAVMLYVHWRFWKDTRKSFMKALLNHLEWFPFILLPLTLLGIFYWFQISLNDFWAYFHSGDNIHLTFPPFQVFNKNQPWVGEIWLEDVVYIFLLGLLGGLLLIKQKLYPLAFFVLTYLVAIFSVAHRDIARYSLPIFPFLLIAFEKVLVSREFRIVVLIVALAIYLYAQNFLLHNTAPVPNVAVFN